MKFLYLFILLSFATYSSFAQKLVIKEIGFQLKAEERAYIEGLATYEVKIFNGLFNHSNNDSLVITINLYNKGKDFRSVVKQFGLRGFTESGFYSPVNNQSYVLYQNINQLEVILHEMSHALLRKNMKYPPRWFNEGLAEFLESLQEKGLEIQIQAQFHYLDRMREENRKSKTNISAFLNDKNGWRDKSKIDYMYTVYYSMVYYIIKQNPKLIGKMASMMNNGDNIEEIFDACFGGMKRFENNFNFYFR